MTTHDHPVYTIDRSGDLYQWPYHLPKEQEFLRVQGTPPHPLLDRGSVAIVGARSSTMYGSDVAWKLGEEVTLAGGTVVSSGTYGINSSAVRGALSVGGRPVVILPSGIDHWYPRAHANLFDQVIESGGSILSPYEDGVRPTRQTIKHQAKMIAEIADLLMVVESGWNGTALMQANSARGLVAAVPGPITSETSKGSNNLIAGIARPLVNLDLVVNMLQEVKS